MRLTDKNNKYEHLEFADPYWRNISVVDVFNKLADLEDIEDELGIDLITLFKAIKNGIYTKPYDLSHINFGRLGAIDYQRKRFRSQRVGGNYYKFKDYGKTWALTKEELEK